MTTEIAFHGAKLILFVGARLLVIRRDDTPDIPYPNHLDFPGGGREAGESPQDCVIRETREEVGLKIPRELLSWKSTYAGENGLSLFFAAHLPDSQEDEIELGDEGQSWHLVDPEAYVKAPLAIPHFIDKLQEYLASPQYLVLSRKTPREEGGGK